jgi:hypothetical protein
MPSQIVKKRSPLLTIAKATRNKPMNNPSQDFAPLPIYQETSTSNGSWVNVTLTKTEPDGSKTQTSTIVSKK